MPLRGSGLFLVEYATRTQRSIRRTQMFLRPGHNFAATLWRWFRRSRSASPANGHQTFYSAAFIAKTRREFPQIRDIKIRDIQLPK